MIYRTIILREKFSLLVVLSFILFWLRAVNCEINLYNISKLALGLAINFPILFLVSPYMRFLQRQIFGGNQKYKKLGIYLIFIILIYSVLVAERVYSSHSYFVILIVLIIVHVWQPLLLLLFGYLLMSRFSEPELTIKVIIFILGIGLFNKISDFLLISYRFLIRYDIHDLALFKVYYFHDSFYVFTLYGFWWFCLTFLIILLSDNISSQINLEKKWNKKAILHTSLILYYFIFSSTLNIYLYYQPLTVHRFVWNFLASIYPAIETSFFEEIIFRGILQTYFCTKLSCLKRGNIIAVIFSSIIFGVFHYPFTNGSFPHHFIHGFLFGWLYYKTNNIWTSISIHGFNNSIALAILQ